MKPATCCFALAALLAHLAAAQFTVDPPTTAPEDTIQDCTNWHIGSAGETCADIVDLNFISLEQLYRYNPSLEDGCNIEDGISYCVEENWGIPPPVTTTTTTASPTQPTTTGIVTPQPTQSPAIVAGCTQFHFVRPGAGGCGAILTQFGITLAQFYAWNSGVGPDCSGLWAEVYVCVAGPSVGESTTTTTTSNPNPTSTGTNGIATPAPTQPPSITPNCNKFYFVEPGTSCTTVLSANGITLAQLFAWNSGVGADCLGMWAGVHLCVGVIGGSTPTTSVTTTTSTTTAGNGITTPTPTQPPSIVSNCNKFYFVQTGTSCTTVLSVNGITLAQLYAWNSGVGADCSGMWAGVHLCVGVIGGPPPVTTTSTRTSTTNPTSTGANGIVTPSPTQPPSITPNCNKFYFVQPGTSCNTVLSANGITLPQLFAWNSGVGADCSGMWAGVHLCVGVIGGTPTTTRTTTTTTSTGNGIATPTPVQPGMVNNCRRFHRVVSGDTCAVISSKTGVSTQNILRWNTQLGSSCNVWLGYVICIGV